MLTYTGPQNSSIQYAQIPKIESGNIVVKSLYSGISRGTESLVFKGQVPEDQWQIMRCPNQKGDFSFPLSYGYACVGEVIHSQAGTSEFEIGDVVFALHPHQDVFQISADMCVKLQENIPASRGVLTANMETALNAVWDSEIENGQTDHHAIIGAGVVGLLTGYVVKQLTGKTPLLIDINPAREKIADALGLEFITAEKLHGHNLPEMEIIFHTSASQQGLQTAINLSAFEAKIIEMSWYGEKQVSVSLGGNFHSNRLQIISSQVGHVATSKRKTYTHKQRMGEAVKFLQNEKLDLLLEPAIEFMALPDHLERIFNDQHNVLCQLVKYSHI